MLSPVGIPQAFSHLNSPMVAAARQGHPGAKKMIGSLRYAGLDGHPALTPVTVDGSRGWGVTTPCGKRLYTPATKLFVPPPDTLIIATLGPATDQRSVARAMIREGVGVARMNMSHGRWEEHLARAENFQAAAEEEGVQVAIMGDLQGAKIRVGKYPDGVKVLLEKGQAFVLDANRQTLGDQHGVGLDYKALPADVLARLQTGTEVYLLLNDGKVRLRVNDVVDGAIHTTVVRGGEMSSNKGINLEGGGLSAPAMTPKDEADVGFLLREVGVDYLAVSFPKGPGCMENAQRLVDAALPKGAISPGLIAKLEQKVAVGPSVLPAVTAACSAGVMVAAGDLADEVGINRLPIYQTRIVDAARAQNKFSIVATGLMDPMITEEIPERANVRSVDDAVRSGANAVMTSAETAVGKYPVETIKAMAEVVVNRQLEMAGLFE